MRCLWRLSSLLSHGWHFYCVELTVRESKVKLNFSLLSSSGECNVQSHFKWNVLGGKSLCNAALVSHCLRDSSLMLNAKGFMTSKTDPERMKELPLYTFITLLALKFFFLHPGISSVCVSFHRTNFSNGNPPGVIVLGGVCFRKIDGHTFSDTLAKDSLFCLCTLVYAHALHRNA